MNGELESVFPIKKFFFDVSNKFNKTCSDKCGVQLVEEYICRIKTVNDFSELNYESTLQCYDNCLAKHFYSAMVGVSQLERKLIM